MSNNENIEQFIANIVRSMSAYAAAQVALTMLGRLINDVAEMIRNLAKSENVQSNDEIDIPIEVLEEMLRED